MVMVAVLLVLNRRFLIGSLALLFSVLVRQNNIAWAPLLMAVAATMAAVTPRKRVLAIASATIGFVILGILFALFVIINKGVAIGDRAAHPAFSFHTGNIAFTLFMMGVFFGPIGALRWKNAIRMQRSWWLAITLLTLILFGSFENSHPYNGPGEEWYLRNAILIFAARSLATRAVFFIPVLVGLLFAAYSASRNASLVAVYAASIPYLAASWLVEPRYSLIPVTAVALLRPMEEERSEWLLLGWFIVGSAILYYGTALGWFFI